MFKLPELLRTLRTPVIVINQQLPPFNRTFERVAINQKLDPKLINLARTFDTLPELNSEAGTGSRDVLLRPYFKEFGNTLILFLEAVALTPKNNDFDIENAITERRYLAIHCLSDLGAKDSLKKLVDSAHGLFIRSALRQLAIISDSQEDLEYFLDLKNNRHKIDDICSKGGWLLGNRLDIEHMVDIVTENLTEKAENWVI